MATISFLNTNTEKHIKWVVGLFQNLQIKPIGCTDQISHVLLHFIVYSHTFVRHGVLSPSLLEHFAM